LVACPRALLLSHPTGGLGSTAASALALLVLTVATRQAATWRLATRRLVARQVAWGAAAALLLLGCPTGGLGLTAAVPLGLTAVLLGLRATLPLDLTVALLLGLPLVRQLGLAGRRSLWE
jgi:hypothetical protein